jgi:hypothetical protein
MSEPALKPEDNSVVLWAESPEEARIFLAKASAAGYDLGIQKIFVAKKSGRTRTNAYLRGEYYPASVDDAVDVYNTVVIAPQSIIDLVDWCTCDVMISRGDRPLLVLEDTTHIVRMNLYQRVPRLARAASLGVPAIMLQGTRGIDLTKRGDRWGLYRYLQAFEAIARVHPDCPVVVLWFLPTAAEESRATKEAFAYIEALMAGDEETVSKIQHDSVCELRRVKKLGVEGDIARDLPCIQHSDASEVTVKVGAKPDKKSWREKGSGQMDPYLGLILAAKYIYCYDEAGKKNKDLNLEFTFLPPGFWFFADPTTTSLYKRLPIEFADKTSFLG